MVNLAHISRINNNYFYTNGVEISGCYDIPDNSAIKFRNLIPENFSSTRFGEYQKRGGIVWSSSGETVVSDPGNPAFDSALADCTVYPRA